MNDKSTDIAILEKPLTNKQKRFCEEYVVDWNGTRAAIAAGYSIKTAKAIANENLTKPNVKAYVDHVKQNLEQLAGISKLRVINEHIKIAFSSIAHMHNTWIDRKEFENLSDDQKACISEIETTVVKKNIGTSESPEIVDVEKIKVKLYDKQKSLDAITKLMGYNEEKQTGGDTYIQNNINIAQALDDNYRNKLSK